MYDGGFFMGSMHGLWWLLWITLLAVLLLAVWTRPAGRRGGHRETPHEILRRRLASGEIDAQEYEQRRTLLDRDTGGRTEPSR